MAEGGHSFHVVEGAVIDDDKTGMPGRLALWGVTLPSRAIPT